MISPNTADTDAVAAITAGLVDRRVLATHTGMSERTIIRWEHAGCPVIRLGTLRLYDPAKVRAWLLTHERRPNAPKRGRPRKHAA